MAKVKSVIAWLVIVCLLSACGNSGPDNELKKPAGAKPTLSVRAAESVPLSTVEWSGIGGCYLLETFEVPEDTRFITANGDDFYYITFSPDNGEACRLIENDLSVLYTMREGMIYSAAVCENGVWISERTFSAGAGNNRLSLISNGGEVRRSFELDSAYETTANASSILYASGNLYVVCEKELIILDEVRGFICVIGLPESFSRAVLGGDGEVYVIETTDDGNDIFEVDLSEKTLTPLFSCVEGTIYCGNDDVLFILAANDGLYGIGQDTSEAIVIWEECSISVGSLRKVMMLSDDRFFLQTEGVSYILKPADASDMPVKKRLVIASIGESYSNQQSALRFNDGNEDYYVEIIDYTMSGAFTEAEALMRLNTEMLSGKIPDMICFSSLSPHTFIGKGYLVDMREYFEADDEINLDDIAIAKALESEGGVYYIGNEFFLETMLGLHSSFGDRYGWKFAEYLDMEAARPPGAETLYNTTKAQFLRRIGGRYIRTAIDWKNGSCDFDNDVFIEILNASARVKENPEDTNNMVFGPGAPRVANGTLIGASSWCDYVWKLAQEEAMAGCRLSFIGWPTVDGSCGSDIYLSEPLGIASQSANGAGCWEFIKFMLMDVEHTDAGLHGLPTYLPALEGRVDDAKNNQDLPLQMSETDAERFFDLLFAVDSIAIYDETVLKIIKDESGALFNGDKTTSDVARIIQSRVGIYVAEQS